MASILPPSPQGVPPGHAFWNVWYEKLRIIINNIATSIQWVNLNFTGSKIEDIVSRDHNKLTSIQGGTTAEYYHLTNAQYITVTGLANPDITGTGVNMTIKPAVPGTGVNSGTISLTGQTATGTNKNGGNIVCQAGDGTGTGVGGQCSFYSGGARTGGAINFVGGQGTISGGNVNLNGGDATGTNGTGGSFQLFAGNGTGTGGKGGHVYIYPGTGVTTPGTVYIYSSGGAYPGMRVTDDNAGNTKISFFNPVPILQPTNAGAASVFVANAGVAVNDTSTFDGYTIGQVVKALRSLGLLA